MRTCIFSLPFHGVRFSCFSLENVVTNFCIFWCLFFYFAVCALYCIGQWLNRRSVWLFLLYSNFLPLWGNGECRLANTPQSINHSFDSLIKLYFRRQNSGVSPNQSINRPIVIVANTLPPAVTCVDVKCKIVFPVRFTPKLQKKFFTKNLRRNRWNFLSR